MNTLLWALLVLGVLIFVHELGHFLVARWRHVHVLKFSLGFGPKLIGWQPKGSKTEYLLSAVPLGGYVKMLGESGLDEENSDEDPIAPEDLPYAFSSQTVGTRFAIVVAGPVFNFLFALLALTVTFMLGIDEKLPVVGTVTQGMPAEAAGLQAGDRITFVNETSVDRWEALSRMIRSSEGGVLKLTVIREERALYLPVMPQVQEVPNLFGEPVRVALIGITPGEASERVYYGPLDALVLGVEKTWYIIDITLTGIWKLITRSVAADQIGGPLLIADLAGKSAAQGVSSLLFFMALISINLGILNLLPIPILDGGHLAFFALEAIKGTPVSDHAQVLAHRTGMALLVGLMMLAFYNDIARMFPDLLP